MVVNVQFMLMLTELKKVLSQDLKCLCSKTTTVCQNELYQKLWMRVSYIFIALEINKLYINVSIKYRNIYMLYIQYAYTLQVCMSISVIVIHCVG